MIRFIMQILALFVVASTSLLGADCLEKPPESGFSECPPILDTSLFHMDKRGAPPQQPLWFTKGKPPKHQHADGYSAQLECAAKDETETPQIQDILLQTGRICPQISPGGIRYEMAFLIWQSKMWGLEYAGKSLLPTNQGSAATTIDEKIYIPDFAWRPGFKIDLGYDFDFDGWDLDGRWTFYRGEDTSLKKRFDAQTSPPGMGIIPLWFYPFYTVSAPNQIRFHDSAMKWRHYFNSIDLEIGRDSALSESLSMRIFGGLKGAWIHQYYRVNYTHGTTIDAVIPGELGTVPLTLLESAAAFKNKTWGAGPRVGLDSLWKFGWGFSLIADASLSLLFSKIETDRDQNDLNLNNTTNIQAPFSMRMNTASQGLKPVLEAIFGLDWETCIYNSSVIDLRLSYEFQYWWAQNELRRGYSHTAPGDLFSMRGDLQMHGLTFEAGYAY